MGDTIHSGWPRVLTIRQNKPVEIRFFTKLASQQNEIARTKYDFPKRRWSRKWCRLQGNFCTFFPNRKSGIPSAEPKFIISSEFLEKYCLFEFHLKLPAFLVNNLYKYKQCEQAPPWVTEALFRPTVQTFSLSLSEAASTYCLDLSSSKVWKITVPLYQKHASVYR